jgi:hypothetical protein
MIYTCYDMVRDCRENKPEGWRYFTVNYVPVLRGLIAHYFPDRASDHGLIERVLANLRRPDSNLFQSAVPAPEGDFVFALRQHALAAVELDRATEAPDIMLDLETLAAALEPLTLTEKQAVWFETMRHGNVTVGRMLRMEPATVEKIRGKASELIRGKVDAWRRTLIAENGPQLGRAAAMARTPDCLPVKHYFDVIDGRMNWYGREAAERHVTNCWHCIDQFCRSWVVCDLLRTNKPLSDADAVPYLKTLGIEREKKPFWKRVLARG